MSNPLIPYSFIPGTKAKANEVNANFIALADNITEISAETANKLNKDFSNISKSGLDFLKENTAPSRNIGEIVASTLPLTDAGLHLLDGALIDGYGIYSAFVDYIASIYDASASYFCTEAEWQQSVTDYGVCGKFVYNSVNNTVRLPKVTGILEGTTDVTALGDLVEQFVRLPNITGGYVQARIYTNSPFNNCYGAFRLAGNAGDLYNAGNSDSHYADFDASRSSSVYSGNGTDTVIQPQAIKYYYYIVIATSTKTDIQVDIDEIATDLNGKADTDFTNCTDVANIKMAHNAMPSDKYIDLTLGASGTTYTAPADGYYFINKVAGSDWYYTQIINQSVNMSIFSSEYRTSPCTCIMPAKKGDTVQVNYNASGTLNAFRFIYAIGSESEAN